MRSENPIVTAIREVFPGFDSSLWSKTQYPERYGIKLLPRAQVIADKAQKRRKKRDKRRGKTLSLRLGDELLARLQTAKDTMGVLTFQEILTISVIKLCESLEEGK